MDTLHNPTATLDEVEMIARGRVAELVAVYDLPDPQRVSYLQDYNIMIVSTHQRADVARWGAILGAKATTEHDIYESPKDQSWQVSWTEVVRVRAWLPDLNLTVKHFEARWIDAPAAAA